ncbi:7-cyano-7-deazaguanine synthase [bacterium BMS3Bbin10]|nr:7-cyano-7-deazaguanine synthase [bacterium BMS3Bbin10]
MSADNRQNTAALLLFSGGQDSTACLAWALERYARVETVGFDYGQRHNIELSCRQRVREEISERFPQWRARLGADHMIEMPALGKISDTALTRDVAIEMQQNGLPNTFVPGRNLLFFTYAAALAYRRGLMALIGGMCETDFSGYPDCREETLQTLAKAIRLGTEKDLVIETPLMHLTKAQTWALVHELGGDALTALIVEHTHSCYLGERGKRHEWGYGCGDCPACALRARGYREWRCETAAAQTR